MLSLFIAVFGQKLVAGAASLVAAGVVGAGFATLKAGWRSLVARGEQADAAAAAHAEVEKSTALARLADFAGRAAHMLNLAVLASPEDAARIQAVLDELQADMTAEVRDSLAKVGGDATGVGRLITRAAAAQLPARAAAAAAAAGVDPQAAVQAAAGALLRVSGLAR
ncbi:hypothetical protein [Roseomonas indoligenes]|uniref:Uncharacterized protein n=1 Tax=Roseomonas indoligenes TaxID=2820811 RepID=A0A940MYQ2_9PROT|nr:hypothetical protein [Pararoseomonas indoligenes]MBP0492886.1 hypothetical protein [Pararoseomonas indoligenes]